MATAVVLPGKSFDAWCLDLKFLVKDKPKYLKEIGGAATAGMSLGAWFSVPGIIIGGFTGIAIAALMSARKLNEMELAIADLLNKCDNSDDDKRSLLRNYLVEQGYTFTDLMPDAIVGVN